MKAWKIFLGILCILIAVFGILDTTGIMLPIEAYVGEISWLNVFAALFFTFYWIKDMLKFKIRGMILCTSLIFCALEKNIAFVLKLPDDNIINDWYLLLFTLLLCLGLTFLSPKRRKKKLNKDMYKGHRLASGAVYIDCSDFNYRHIENNMGSTEIHFENTEEYLGTGKLEIENNMGSVKVFVPSKWSVDCNIDNNLGNISNTKSGFCANGPLLVITGNNNMGSINISPIE